ncbi:MAG: FecR domain-containing protein [Sandaracinaceae bacterium]
MNELDALLAEARSAEPDTLDAAEVDRWVDAARTGDASAEGAPKLDVLAALLAEAKEAEPAALDELSVRRMAERAAMTGRARHQRGTRRWLIGSMAVAAAAAAAAVTLFLAEPTPTSSPRAEAPLEETHEATEVVLSTGDRLRASAGTRFGVEVETETARRVRLEGGAMLFDVRPIEGGEFVVSTPRAEVTVLGTVFSVATSERGTTVRVYEGRVRVENGERVREVAAGGVVHLGGGRPDRDPLAEAGTEAARRRAPAEQVELPSAPTVEAHAASSVPTRRPRATAPSETEQPTETEQPAETESTPPPEPRPATASELRQWIAAGDAELALVEARARISSGQTAPWRMLEGDALRSLGRAREAADVYRYASEELPSPGREQAAFLEARLRAGPLGDDVGALHALRHGGVLAPGSLLRERGMATEVELLHRMDLETERRLAVARYLAAYPDGPSAAAFEASEPAPE